MRKSRRIKRQKEKKTDMQYHVRNQLHQLAVRAAYIYIIYIVYIYLLLGLMPICRLLPPFVHRGSPSDAIINGSTTNSKYQNNRQQASMILG